MLRILVHKYVPILCALQPQNVNFLEQCMNSNYSSQSRCYSLRENCYASIMCIIIMYETPSSLIYYNVCKYAVILF